MAMLHRNGSEQTTTSGGDGLDDVLDDPTDPGAGIYEVPTVDLIRVRDRTATRMIVPIIALNGVLATLGLILVFMPSIPLGRLQIAAAIVLTTMTTTAVLVRHLFVNANR